MEKGLAQFISPESFVKVPKTFLEPLDVYIHKKSKMLVACVSGEYQGAFLGSIVWIRDTRAAKNRELYGFPDTLRKQFVGLGLVMATQQIENRKDYTAEFYKELVDRIGTLCEEWSLTEDVCACDCMCTDCSNAFKDAAAAVMLRKLRARSSAMLAGNSWKYLMFKGPE
jgi:hypothetical protein